MFNGKVRDHCHFTGKFRRIAHNKCNLKSRVPKEVTTYFQNLSVPELRKDTKILIA